MTDKKPDLPKLSDKDKRDMAKDIAERSEKLAKDAKGK